VEILQFDDGYTGARFPTAVSPGGFDADLYLSQFPDLEANGVTADTAYAHYVAYGAAEGRAPNAFFDSAWYLARNRDVAEAGVNPLRHFYESGWMEDRDPSAWFDSALYLA